MIDDVGGGIWKVDTTAVVQEVGLGLLSKYKVRCIYMTSCMLLLAHGVLTVQDTPVDEGTFLGEWRRAVGDSLEESVSLPLLIVS